MALVATSVRDLWHFRRALVESLLSANVDVWFVGPDDDPDREYLRAGVRMVPWQLNRGSTRLVRNGAELVGLARIYARLRPVLVHQFGVKAVIYGSIVARVVRPRPTIISTIPGLGHAFVGENSLLRWIVRRLYASAVVWSDALVFLNADDARTLGVEGLAKAHITSSGEGVDLAWFRPDEADGHRVEQIRRELGVSADDPVVLMVSRMIEEKGVREFVAAGDEVRQRHPRCRFVLVGEVDAESPARVPLAELQRWVEEGRVLYLGRRRDVRELIAVASAVVLPTYYREGLPQILLEGSAMERPLVASDVPGCREIVRPGLNGILVPPRDVRTLAGAIVALLENDQLRQTLGRGGRRLVEQQFGRHHALSEVLRVYRDVLERRPLAGESDGIVATLDA